MDYAKESLRLHAEWKGKIEVKATVPVETKDDLSHLLTRRASRSRAWKFRRILTRATT